MVNFQFDASYPTFRIARDFEVKYPLIYSETAIKITGSNSGKAYLYWAGFIKFTGFYIIAIMLELSETFDINEHGVSG